MKILTKVEAKEMLQKIKPYLVGNEWHETYRLAIEALEKQIQSEADGCEGCKYNSSLFYDKPCKVCKRQNLDFYKSKDDVDCVYVGEKMKMTKEQALNWYKEELKDGKCREDCPQCNAYEKAIEVLEKDEKYRWHDLRETPQDLPENNSIVYVHCKDGVELKVGYDNGFNCCGDCTKYKFNDVVAWKYIDHFKED